MLIVVDILLLVVVVRGLRVVVVHIDVVDLLDVEVDVVVVVRFLLLRLPAFAPGAPLGLRRVPRRVRLGLLRPFTGGVVRLLLVPCIESVAFSSECGALMLGETRARKLSFTVTPLLFDLDDQLVLHLLAAAQVAFLPGGDLRPCLDGVSQPPASADVDPVFAVRARRGQMGSRLALLPLHWLPPSLGRLATRIRIEERRWISLLDRSNNGSLLVAVPRIDFALLHLRREHVVVCIVQ